MATGTTNPPGSQDPRDLRANAENIDLLIMGPASSYPDRLGGMRKSWAGIIAEASNVLPAIQAAAQAAMSAEQAELSASVAAATANQFPTVADGLAATSGSGSSNRFFSVPGTGNTFSIQYRNDAGVAVEIGRSPSAILVQAIAALITSFTSAVVDPQQLILTDAEGALLAELTASRLTTTLFEISSRVNAALMGDTEGGVSFYCDEFGSILGHLQTLETDLPGLFVVDPYGAILNDLSDPSGAAAVDPISPFEGGLLFNPTLVTAANAESYIHVKSLLQRREQIVDVVATLSSSTTSAQSSGDVLPVSQLRFGDQAVLNLRELDTPDSRRFMTLNLKNVAVQVGSPVIKVLMIGDSITNYAGAYILNQYLVGLGFAPQFIGTINGAAPGQGATGTGGPLNEGRHGWQARDFTYAINRKLVIAPGSEASYLAMPKSSQVDYNPFLRASVGGDDPSIVRNGYVFDPAFYQARFTLDTPDIVITSLGTNDAFNIPSSDVYDSMFESDRIMHSQILAAWPSAKILRALPGTAIDSSRNSLWSSAYTKIIAALQQSAKDLGARVSVAPLWAMTNPDGGYGFPAGTPGSDGFVSGNWSDDIHPIGATRYGYYQAMAPFVAAQKLNII